jgi:hypothetical protein
MAHLWQSTGYILKGFAIVAIVAIVEKLKKECK